MASGEREVGTASTEGSGPSLRALLKVVVYKRLLLEIRYPLNFLAQLLTMLFFFVVIFYGGRAVAGPRLGESLDGIIVGFFLFSLAITAYSNLSWAVTREAQWGTLERLYMSPHGIGTIMGVKTAVNVVLSFVWGAVILLVMMAITGRWLTVDVLTVVPLATLMVASVIGLGFAFAGLGLLFKRIENVFQLVQFAFIGLIAAPAGRVEWLKLLPVTHGGYLTRVAVTEGVRLWQFSLSELGLLLVTATLYLATGYYCFQIASTRARDEGLLAHY